MSLGRALWTGPCPYPRYIASSGGGEVASSSSSITLAFTVAAEDENSESSRDGVRHSTVLLGGVESNLKRSEKPSS